MATALAGTELVAGPTRIGSRDPLQRRPSRECAGRPPEGYALRRDRVFLAILRGSRRDAPWRKGLRGDARHQDFFSLSALSEWAAYFSDDALSLDALQRSTRTGTTVMSWGFNLWRPASKNVRRLPGFKTLLREQGFVDYWRKSGNWGDFCKPAGTDDFECR